MGELIDAKKLTSGSTLEADVAIVGAGAAGLSLASRLSESELEVLVVESGSMQIDGDTQALYQGQILGLPYWDLMGCRLRYFGGTTNHWRGFSAPVIERDFRPVEGIDLTSWPISFQDLEPYLREASVELGYEPSDFDAAERMRRAGYEPLPDDDPVLRPQVFAGTPQSLLRFGERYLPELEPRPNVRIVLDLSATNIGLDESGRIVRHIKAKTIHGIDVSVRAGAFVLACHGIENARLLMASNDVVAVGLGNEGDFLGRCFMDHAYLYSGILAAGHLPDALNDNLVVTRGFTSAMVLRDEVLDKERLLHYRCRIRGPEPFSTPGERALNRLTRKWDKRFERSMLNDVVSVLNDLPGVLSGVSNTLLGDGKRPLVYLLQHGIEQAPNRNSRVVLSDKTDVLGSRRADLDWQITDDDIRTFQMGQKAVVRYLGAMGFGRVETTEITRGYIEENVHGWRHHIGTTRMSVTPQNGVVNANCKVHGTSNLYVAGSSLFCRSMSTNPTMPIVAFSFRLADHIRSVLA